MNHRLRCLLLLIVLAPIGIIATLSVILYSILFPMVKDNRFTKFGTWYADLLEEIGLWKLSLGTKFPSFKIKFYLMEIIKPKVELEFITQLVKDNVIQPGLNVEEVFFKIYCYK